MVKATKLDDIPVRPPHDWRTTDEDEINKRRLRAREESFRILNFDSRHPIFSNFRVGSSSGLTYSVEIRDLHERQFVCDCVDFRINGLGTCKHVEAVLLHLESRFRRLFRAAHAQGSTRIDIVADPATQTLRVMNGHSPLPPRVQEWFDENGRLAGFPPEEAVPALRELSVTDCPQLRVSQEIAPWLESRRRAAERKQLRHGYELKVQSGEWPAQETKSPLFPYQREGMLHLAFTERALLADEMGLGKTIQAIAACALLYRLGQANCALIVTPASLKTEWEDQIQRFTDLPYQLVFGPRAGRLRAYENAPFFTVVNYEQMLADTLDVNGRLQPDIVVLDEAQRIKNWSTKTAQAIKRLRSRYAFVLTGTPIENRIDELHSLMDFLDPSVLGPLFRFNRDFYKLDDRGRPEGYRNLDQLHHRIKPHMLRRLKADVETELPERTDQNHFVPLSAEQQTRYDEFSRIVQGLLRLAERRLLTKEEQDRLLRTLGMMRMTCDTNYILDPNDRACPKLAELEKLLEECRENQTKAIIFSEWERMLERVRELCRKLDLGFAWHTGSVPQLRRRAEINAFKSDPACAVFLSTDSGSTGLNLQNASVVINCDLPWNPARLEQRIARAWRKNQTRPVTVVNLVSENTIEHRMLETLATKQAVADSVLDLRGDLKEIKLRGGRQAFLARLKQMVSPTSPALPDTDSKQTATVTARPPADRALAFAQQARQTLNTALVRCEERYPAAGAHTVLLVVTDGNPAQYRPKLETLHQTLFNAGTTDPLAPVHLEVIDRATDEALQRLLAAGLLSTTTRATRPLFPLDATAAVQPLSEAERAEIQKHREQAQRKLKIARLLSDGGLDDEARPHLLEATLAWGRALAVENRFPAPAQLEDALLPPFSHFWKESLPVLRSFAADPAAPCRSVVAALDSFRAS